MKHSLNEAAKLCGRSKSTLSNSIKNNKLRAFKNEQGRFEIDPVELDRVFPYAVLEQNNKQPLKPVKNTESEHEHAIENSALKAKLEAKDELFKRLELEIEDLKEQREHQHAAYEKLDAKNDKHVLLLENHVQKASIKPKGWFKRLVS